MTTKPPSWRDPYVLWPSDDPALGDPHPGFFYPDPLGFWSEVRRWSTVLLRLVEPAWAPPEALAVSALLHVGDEPERLAWAQATMAPQVVLFLDEPAATASGLTGLDPHRVTVPDPHRAGQSYEGWWARSGGQVVGKAPQHPAAHKLYRAADLDGFLQAAPIRPGGA